MWPTPFVSVLSLPLGTTSYAIHENAVVVQTSNNHDGSKGESVLIWTGGMEILAVLTVTVCTHSANCGTRLCTTGRVWVRFWCGLIDKDFLLTSF
jgi:hypothetical protein